MPANEVEYGNSSGEILQQYGATLDASSSSTEHLLSNLIIAREEPMDDKSCIDRFRSSPYLIICIVCLSLFNDSLLLTLVDPILPEMLYNLEHPEVMNLTELNATTTEPVRDPNYSDDINNKGRYGYLIAAKSVAQFVCNPFVGYIVTRFGYRKPMLFGNIALMVSTLAFPFSWNYWLLIGTRIIQGISSSFTAVTALGLVAATFKNDYKRGKIIGYAFGGLSIGIIAGPVYGSLLFEFVNPAFPFELLAGVMAFTLILQLLTMQMEDSEKHIHGSMLHLLSDSYILIVALNIFLLNLDVSIVLAFLPIRLLDLTNPSTWQLGIVVLPTSCGYLAAGLIFPRMVKFFPRWLQGVIGLFFSAIGLMALAYCITFTSMLISTSFLGLVVGMISTSMQPIFALVVDKRHTEVYGNVYAISDMAVCLSMSLGPLIGGPVVYSFGFEALVYGAAILDLVFCPFTLLLRHIPESTRKDEEKPLLNDSQISKA